MNAEAGWYPYPGDPEGTVRRWSGAQWIGYPMSMPSALPPVTLAAESQTPRRPFTSQSPLGPFAVFTAAGMVITIGLLVDVILELFELYRNGPDNRASSGTTALAITDPIHHVSTQRLGIAILGSGVLFLAWLWRAHRNLERPIRWSRSGAKWIFSAIIGMMFDLIEVTDETDASRITPFSGAAWWRSWLFSAYLIPLTWLFLWMRRWEQIQARVSPPSLVVMLVLLAVHLVSLILALKLVLQITLFQDRRLVAR